MQLHPLRAASLDRPMALSDHAQGVALVLAAAVSFGLLGTLSGLAYRAGMGSATFTTLRAGIGALVLAVLVLSGQRAAVSLTRIPRREQAMLGAAVVANATLNLALFAAYGAMSVALVLAVYFTYPLLVAVASVALGRERFTPARTAGLALAAVGIVLVVGSQVGPGVAVSWLGLATAATAALCQATSLVVSRSGYTRVPSVQATGIILTGGALLAGAVALLVDGSAGRLTVWLESPEAWGAVLIAGTLCAALAKVWLLRGVRRVGGTRTAVLMLGEPLTGVWVAALVLGQAVTAPELIGGAAILGAAFLVQRPAPGPRRQAVGRAVRP
jgi:drug/metabolite transporter (DMT)-like permease